MFYFHFRGTKTLFVVIENKHFCLLRLFKETKIALVFVTNFTIYVYIFLYIEVFCNILKAFITSVK